MKYDITKYPIQIIRSFTLKLEGDDEIRYASEYPELVNIPGPYATEMLDYFDSPHECCMVTSMEFARRYPYHENSKAIKEGFTDDEVYDITRGRKKLIFVSYNIDPDELKNDKKTKAIRKIKKVLPRLSRPDFSKEPMELQHIYDYWLEGDDLNGKPRGGVDIPQFSNISLYKAELNKWVKEDADYSVMADIEFCRRHPKHKFAKESQFYKLFTHSEILDICKGRKRLIFENCFEFE
ncbi:MAG: hypothetical protein BWY19_00200 [bacterium ADurb.Bin212]|nr:MAG: hypothetical protein BWY19_00200 [bacterium ADurb.Bin212]